MRRPFFAVLLAVAAALPGSARALSIEPASSAFAGLTVELLGVGFGLPAAGVLLAGTVAPGDPVVVMRLRLAGDAAALGTGFAADALGAAAFSDRLAAGAGTIEGADVGVRGADFVEVAGRQEVGFTLADPLEPGGATDPFFLVIPGLVAGDRVGVWRVAPGGCTAGPAAGGGSCFGRRDFVGGQVVPEPGTALLAGVGLAGLAARRVPRRVDAVRAASG